MLTSSLDSEPLVRRRVWGLWVSLWSGHGPFGGLLTELLGVVGPLLAPAAGGWGPFGGLLTELLGVVGPLLAPAAGGWGPFGGLLTELLGVVGPLLAPAAGGWGPFGGLLTELLGVVGPLLALLNLWLGAALWVVRTARGRRTVVGVDEPLVRGRLGGCWG